MRASISIDLDEIPCYCAIYGIPVPADERATAIYDHALPRLLAWLRDENIRATLFVVARDLERPRVREQLISARDEGHEIASHSRSHWYDLTRRPTADRERDIVEATVAIAECIGTRPVGFRAPGYTITDATLRILERDGYLYDSSVFPCPLYYGAKASAMTLLSAMGRTSRSILDNPRVLMAPADPYRVGASYRERGHGLIELPIGVTRDATLRLPFIGTYVALASERVATWLTRGIVGRPHVNLELHGIDLADRHDDRLDFLAPMQMDLRKSATEKRRSLAASVRTLRAANYDFVTLEEYARAMPAQ